MLSKLIAYCVHITKKVTDHGYDLVIKGQGQTY